MIPLCFALLALAGDGEQNWPTWRGPDGTGMAAGKAPLTWSDDENVKWKVAIPGRGFSTPVIWGDRIFLTTAVPTGKKPEGAEEPREGGRRFGGAPGPQEEQSFEVHCFRRSDGELLWKKVAKVAYPHEGYHKQYGSFASISPIAEEDRLYVSFGSQGLYAYDHDGELLWEKDFDVEMRMRRAFGEGAAPAIHGNTLVHLFDQEEDSFIAAVDKRNGKELWRQDRDEPSSWAMPLILEHGGKTQVITTGANKVRAYDIKNGKVIWECAGLGLNAIPVPVVHNESVLVMSGYKNANLMAIELGGKGDLSGSDAVLWSTQKGLSYTCSPVLYEGRVYCLMDRGFLSCFDAETGEAYYRETRMPRGTNYKASPVGAEGNLYAAGESGDVHVVKMGTEFELVGTNTLADQFFVSSPVIAGGELFLRSLTHLFCIAEEAD